MTKVYNPKLETQLKRSHAPFATPRYSSTPTLQVNNQSYHYTIHNNGKREDSSPRKRKVLVYSRQGLVPARRFFYHLYHPRWNGEGVIIHLDGDDMNFKRSNLVLLTPREAKNLVHFNNPYPKAHRSLRKLSIKTIRASLILKNQKVKLDLKRSRKED